MPFRIFDQLAEADTGFFRVSGYMLLASGFRQLDDRNFIILGRLLVAWFLVFHP